MNPMSGGAGLGLLGVLAIAGALALGGAAAAMVAFGFTGPTRRVARRAVAAWTFTALAVHVASFVVPIRGDVDVWVDTNWGIYILLTYAAALVPAVAVSFVRTPAPR